MRPCKKRRLDTEGCSTCRIGAICLALTGVTRIDIMRCTNCGGRQIRFGRPGERVRQTCSKNGWIRRNAVILRVMTDWTHAEAEALAEYCDIVGVYEKNRAFVCAKEKCRQRRMDMAKFSMLGTVTGRTP